MNIEEIKKISEHPIRYGICMEVEGDFAMYSRPDSGSEKTSYPVPTFSAVKGMFESILQMPTVFVIPTRVQICKPINYYKYTFNYRGELRKSQLISKENSQQIKFNILSDVCYRLFAIVVNSRIHSDKSVKYKTINHAHSYKDQFNRRLIRGQNNEPPFLGISEFITSYSGVFRESTKVQQDINMEIPSMLVSCFDSLRNGKWAPSFIQNIKIVNGELYYVE